MWTVGDCRLKNACGGPPYRALFDNGNALAHGQYVTQGWQSLHTSGDGAQTQRTPMGLAFTWALPPIVEAIAMKSMTLTAALKDYFGYKPGQTLGEFMGEVKALTTDDREYFKREFVKVGYAISN